MLDEGKDLITWGSAETAVTIMAASIPVLRVLVRDIASSRGYFRSRESKSGSGGGPGGVSSANRSRHQNALGNHTFVQASPTAGTMIVYGNELESPILQHHPVHAADPRRGRDVEAQGDSYEMMWQGRPERPAGM